MPDAVINKLGNPIAKLKNKVENAEKNQEKFKPRLLLMQCLQQHFQAAVSRTPREIIALVAALLNDRDPLLKCQNTD